MESDAVVVEGEKVLSLIDACREKFSAYSYLSQSQGTHILLIDGVSFVRDRSVAAIMVFDFRDSTCCRVDMAVAGGIATGGAESSWLNKIRNFIKEYADENLLKIESVETDFNSSFVPSAPTPESFLKKCSKCGKKIPIASEACEYCGTRQPSRR